MSTGETVTEKSPPVPRRLVFVSHANPQDNTVTLWLTTRLASAGYEVWSDLTQLIGGEMFWTDIAEAIRLHSAKVVSLVSRVAVTKGGFLDELSVATDVERTLKLGDFVIPCRIDDFNFSELPALVHRKNVIDFSGGWHVGLSKLIAKLEKDGVPRRLDEPSRSVATWSKDFLKLDGNLVVADEVVSTNRLPLESLPLSIRMVTRASESALVREAFPWPVVPMIGQRLVTFAAAHELSSAATGGIAPAVDVPTDEFLAKGAGSRGGFALHDARNFLTDLVRQGWERHCKSKGLLAAPMANGRLCWFFPVQPDGPLESTPYTDLDGTKRRKKLVGRSDKRNIFWHCAVEALPFIGNTSYLTLALHVVFTEDGRAPLESAARAHTLRRSFCKSWWQWQWRELMLAFLARMDPTASGLEIAIAPTRFVRFAARPLTFIAPVTTPLMVSPEEELDEPLPADEDAESEWEESEEDADDDRDMP